MHPVHIARELRKNMTRAEKMLWEELRNKKLEACKFRRQHIIHYEQSMNGNKYFIVDFYCPELKLVIEVDGPIHQFQKSVDKRRDEILFVLRYKLLRFTNKEITKNMPQSIDKIRIEIRRLRAISG